MRHDDVEMSYCLDVKFPGRKDWITVNYRRALRDRRASINLEEEDREELLSTAGQVPVVGEDVCHGSGAAGGSVMTMSWRAPQTK